MIDIHSRTQGNIQWLRVFSFNVTKTNSNTALYPTIGGSAITGTVNTTARSDAVVVGLKGALSPCMIDVSQTDATIAV